MRDSTSQIVEALGSLSRRARGIYSRQRQLNSFTYDGKALSQKLSYLTKLLLDTKSLLLFLRARTKNDGLGSDFIGVRDLVFRSARLVLRSEVRKLRWQLRYAADIVWSEGGVWISISREWLVSISDCLQTIDCTVSNATQRLIEYHDEVSIPQLFLTPNISELVEPARTHDALHTLQEMARLHSVVAPLSAGMSLARVRPFAVHCERILCVLSAVATESDILGSAAVAPDSPALVASDAPEALSIAVTAKASTGMAVTAIALRSDTGPPGHIQTHRPEG